MLGENRPTNRSRTKSRKRAPRMGGFFHRGPMDTFNAFRQKCSQEDRDAGWSCTKRVARGATAGETVSTRNFGGDLDSRRREDPRTSQRPTGYGDDTSSSPRATDGRLAGEAAVGECGQVHYTWAHQEAQQIEIPSVNSWTKGSTAGRGVRKFCRSYAAENTSACSVVSATQIRSTPSIQPQIRGTQCLKQEMSQTSVSMPCLGRLRCRQSIPDIPNVEKQIKDLSAVINLEGSVGMLELTSDMEEDDVEDNQLKASMKGSHKLPRTFRGSTPPTKVAQQHLNPRTQKVREMKQKGCHEVQGQMHPVQLSENRQLHD